jgi:hypothetical protein
MKPVTFTAIDTDFSNAETIRIAFEFDKKKWDRFREWVRRSPAWTLYIYNALCAFLLVSLIFALVNISTINPERFYELLGVSVVAFGVASLLWVGRR